MVCRRRSVQAGAAVPRRDPADKRPGRAHLDDGAYGFLTARNPKTTTPAEPRRLLERDAADELPRGEDAVHLVPAAEVVAIVVQQQPLGLRVLHPAHGATVEAHVDIDRQLHDAAQPRPGHHEVAEAARP